jgi:hypothetical protein
MTKPGRIPCIIPFCKRTGDAAKFEGCQIICGKHWRMASPVLRRRRSKMERRYVRELGGAFWKFPAGSAKRLAGVKMHKICDALWERIYRQICNRVAGIG